MNTLKRNEQGFGAVEGLLIVVIVILIGTAGWFIYKNHRSKDTNSAKSSTAQTAKTTATTPAKNYVIIKEWGVRIPLPSNVDTSDIYYVLKDTNSGSNSILWLASHKVSAVAASCDPSASGGTPFGGVERLTPADYQSALNDSRNTGVTSGTKLDNYYYAWQVRRANCAGIPSTASDQANVLMYGGTASNLGNTFILDNFPANMPDVLKDIEVISN